MRRLLVFIAAMIAACRPGSPAPHAPVVIHRPPPRDAAPPDVPPAPPPPGARGDACSPDRACGQGLRCGPLAGGYCTSLCGVGGTACDGACVETGRMGEVCLKRCTQDADCRADEGYVCDPSWHACMVPGFAAIRPQPCPLVGAARDVAWSAPERLSDQTSPGVYQFEPSAVVTDRGSVVAMFITRGAIFEGNVLAVSRTAAPGEPAITAAPVKSDRQSMFDPWLARDRAGTIYAVWYGFDGRDQHGEIALATSRDDGATWSAPVAVNDPADCPEPDEPCLDKPMIAIGPAPGGRGEIVYVMYSADDGGLRVRASRDGGKTFGAPVTALEGIYGNAVVGADGRLHVVTLNGGPMGAYGSAQQSVQYAVSSDGGATFSPPLTVSALNEELPFFFSNPGVAVDTARRWMYFVYVRGGHDARWNLVLAATRDGGKTWVRRTIGDGCAIHMVPELALDPATGTLHVAYYDSEGSPGGRFVHATCTIGLTACSPWGAISTDPIVLSTERHDAKWLGEYESLVLDAQRRVLHAVWTAPAAEGDQLRSRIFHASAKLRR